MVSVVLESLFGLRWWDYTNEPFNFQGRISLAFSMAWGVIGVVFIEEIHPFVKKKVERYILLISNKRKKIILYSLLAIVSIDFILSVMKYI